jgi:homoserine O-succinyltransferase
LSGSIDTYPDYPHNFFNNDAKKILREFQLSAKNMDYFPEDKLMALVENTWVDTGKSLFNNWLGLVYKITSPNRKVPLMEHLDPNNPLNL